MGRSQEQPDLREELRILTTQIETINQQLAGGSGGGGSDPAVRSRLEQVEQKVNYLYELVRGLDSSIQESVKGYFEQVGNQVTHALNTNLANLFAKLEELPAQGGDGGSSKDVVEMKRSLKTLIDVYKDEVAVFKEQNEFLQQKLIDIEKKLDR